MNILNVFRFKPDTKEKRTSKVKTFFQKLKYGITITAEKSWKGAAIGSIIGMAFFIISMSRYIKTGISPVVDVLFIILVIGLMIWGTLSLAKLIFKIVRNFNPLFVGAFIATYIMAGFIPNNYFGRPFILFEMVCGALAGYAIVNGIKKPISIILMLVALTANIYVFYLLTFEGFNNTLTVSDRYWRQNVPSANFIDPSQEGKYLVKEIFYGSGNDKRRPEYGSSVVIKTQPVDATPFFDQSTGFDNYMRKIYWGFNSKKYPINARVWYPVGEGRFPLVLVVHGNHSMIDYSDPGYEYLGKLLASRGFILASVDENFLNSAWSGDYNQGEVFTRGWLLLKHLENWRKWNSTKGNLFYRKIDMDHIALIGHSRGGAAVAVASVMNKLNKYHLDAKQKFNFNFSIKGIVQIAPNDPYNPQKDIPLKPENINYLILQGGFDQDMSWFMGNRVYNRLTFSDGNYHFKTALYIYRANHGQFNTSWGRKDYPAPAAWFLNLKPIMDGNDQREIAKLYISAFLEATLKGRNEYIPLFKDYRQAGKILPKEYYINQFEDSKFKYIADYQEDLDVNTTSLKGCKIEGENLKTWSENALLFKDDWSSSQQNCGVYLGWDKKDTTIKGKPQYAIQVSENALKALQIDSCKNLFFFICNNKEDKDTVDFTIELVTKNTRVKKTFSSFRVLPPVLKTRLTKWNFIYTISKNKPVERVLQYVELPFSKFTRADQNFKPSEITQIRFIFDQTNAGEIFLDKVGVN
jgi:dienelactone hydrolase